MEWSSTMRKSKRLQKGLVQTIVVRLATASSTMLERAQSTVLSLLNRLDDEREDEAPEVYGCRNCGLIYDPQLYHYSDVVQRADQQWSYCPVCNAHGMELLGPLPSTIESPQGTYLLDEAGDTLGPFTDTPASDRLWDWFNRKKNGNCEKEEEGDQEAFRQEGKVIQLVGKGGVYSEGKSQTEEGEGEGT